MKKRKKVFSPLVVTLIAITVIILFITYFLIGCQAMFAYYTDISDEEWIELHFYSAEPGKHLGKYPDNIFCNIYNLKGIEENELLYMRDSYEPAIFLNKEFDEPIKRYSIKNIVITKSDDATIKVDDAAILNQMEQLLQKETGDACYFPDGKYNASIHFDVACDLWWSCTVEKRVDGSIHLIGYDQKEEVFRDYDVSNILNEIY